MVISATYDARDRIVAMGGAIFEHTANGERKRPTGGGPSKELQYDGFGTLRKVVITP
ncbi:MAG: hypothetical protein L0Z50_37735 [Verrucomicrobiales bacterium]|nr:hypothetical protein [Verrucomicrobiales bacterium]